MGVHGPPRGFSALADLDVCRTAAFARRWWDVEDCAGAGIVLITSLLFRLSSSIRTWGIGAIRSTLARPGGRRSAPASSRIGRTVIVLTLGRARASSSRSPPAPAARFFAHVTSFETGPWPFGLVAIAFLAHGARVASARASGRNSSPRRTGSRKSGRLGDHVHGERVHDLRPGDRAQLGDDGGLRLRVDRPIERELDRVGVEVVAIVELDALCAG